MKALERYELLYEAGLVGEAHRAGNPGPAALGVECALDHRRIMATALSRVRGKLTYRPLVFELLPPTFTLSRLQQVVEALIGVRLHTQNFPPPGRTPRGWWRGTGRHDTPPAAARPSCSASGRRCCESGRRRDCASRGMRGVAPTLLTYDERVILRVSIKFLGPRFPVNTVR